jgi:polysaccharide biosynthesis transport protein
MSEHHPEDASNGKTPSEISTIDPRKAGALRVARTISPETVLAQRMQDRGPAQQPPTDPKLLWAAFRRRWLLAVSGGLTLGLIAAAIAWFAIPAPYVVFSELRIFAVHQKLIFDTAEARAGFDIYKQTQAQLVKSPYVLNAALRQPNVSRLTIITEQPHPVQWLESEIAISFPATEFLRLTMSGDRPEEMVTLVNAVTNSYLSEVVVGEQKDRRERLSELEKVLQNLEDQSRAQRNQLERLTINLSTSDSQAIATKLQLAAEHFSRLRKELADVRFSIMRAQIQLKTLETGEKKQDATEYPDTLIEAYISRDREFQKTEAQINDLEELIAKTEKVVRNKDSTYLVSLREKLTRSQETLTARLRPQIIQQLELEHRQRGEETAADVAEKIRVLEVARDELEKEVESQKLEEKQTGMWSFELESLRKEIEHREKISQGIAEEITRLKIELGSRARIEIHRPAEIPPEPDIAAKIKKVGLAGGSVLCLVVGLIVWGESRTRRISSLDDLTNAVSMRIFGALPMVPRGGKTRSVFRSGARAAAWRNLLAESVDSTRVMLLKKAELENAKVVMVCSAMASEGKTTLSCHLATSLARSGKRTLLIDADIRCPTVHRVFDIERSPGLCEMLLGQAEFADAIKPASPAGLSVIASGHFQSEVLRALAQDQLEPLLEKLKEQFDFILIDTSPVMPVTDALMVGQFVDGALLSVRRDVSQLPKVTAAYQRLVAMGIPVWGAVVIGLDSMNYGYRYAYRYQQRHD